MLMEDFHSKNLRKSFDVPAYHGKSSIHAIKKPLESRGSWCDLMSHYSQPSVTTFFALL